MQFRLRSFKLRNKKGQKLSQNNGIAIERALEVKEFTQKRRSFRSENISNLSEF